MVILVIMLDYGCNPSLFCMWLSCSYANAMRCHVDYGSFVMWFVIWILDASSFGFLKNALTFQGVLCPKQMLRFCFVLFCV